MTEERIPTGWLKRGSAPEQYQVGVDREVVYSSKGSGYIKANENAAGFGTLMQKFKADIFHGRRVRLSSYVKSESVKDGAALWMRVDGQKGVVLGFDNMGDRLIMGTTDWTPYSIVLDVPAESVHIAFGVLLEGNGQVWIDGVKLEPVGLDIATTEPAVPEDTREYPDGPLNLSFEE